MDTEVRELFEQLVADPPASAVNVDAAIRAGRLQQARRRQVQVGTAAAAALALAATYSALTGGNQTEPDPLGPIATVGPSKLPDKVEVKCSPSGIEVNAKEIRTRPDGVAFEVSSTLPKGAYLGITHPGADLSAIYGQELPTATTTWVLGYDPGDLVLSCGLAPGSTSTSGQVTIRVSDPDQNWHDRSAIDALGCRGGANADWIAGLYRTGKTRIEAAQAVAEAFRQLDGNDDAVFTVSQIPVSYKNGVNQTWVAYRNGEAYVTVLVNVDGDHFTAGPNDRCSGFDLSAG